MKLLNDLKPVGNVAKQPSTNILHDLKPASVGAGSSGTGTTNFAKIRDAIASQESQGSGGYSAVNPSGALGKYQILPKFHFDKIGLKDTPADRKKYLNSPQLQDTLFEKVLEENKRKHGTDEKAIAAYYGGNLGASNYGTPDGDLQGKYKWNESKQKWDTSRPTGYPSVNEYVASVKSKIANDPVMSVAFKPTEYKAEEFFNEEVDKTVKGIPGAIGGFIKDVFQTAARFPVSIMNEVLGDYKYADKNTTLGKAQRIVFGEKKDNAIKGVYAEAESERGLAKSVGLPEEVGTGAFVVLGSLDYVTGGGASKVIKGLVKVSKLEDAIKLAKQIGVADNLVDDFAKKAVKVKTEKDATELLNAYDTVQKDLVKKGSKVSSNISKETDIETPLINEARKYKSAEEFINAQIKNDNSIFIGKRNKISQDKKRIKVEPSINEDKIQKANDYFSGNGEILGRKKVKDIEKSFIKKYSNGDIRDGDGLELFLSLNYPKDVKNLAKKELENIRKIEIESRGFKGLKLSDFYRDDSDLFKAYPELKDLRIVPDVSMDKSFIGGTTGVFGDGIRIPLKTLNDKKKLSSIIRHEVQHIIQDIEGWERGTTISDAGGFKQYKNHFGEIQARNELFMYDNFDDIVFQKTDSKDAVKKYWENSVKNKENLREIWNRANKTTKTTEPLLKEAPVETIKPKVELTKTPAEIKAEYARKVPEELLPVYENARKSPDLNTFIKDNTQVVKTLGLDDKEAKSSLEYLYKTAKEEKIDLDVYGVTPKITKIQSRIGQAVRPASKNILVKESVALKTRLKALASGAKSGFKSGKSVGKKIGTEKGVNAGFKAGKEVGIDIGTEKGLKYGTEYGVRVGTAVTKDTIKTIQSDAVKFTESHLPKILRGGFLKRVTNAKTPATLSKVISDVAKAANKYKKALAEEKLAKTLAQKFGFINKLSEINRQAISDIKREVGLVDSRGRVKNINQATPEQLEEAIRLAKERFALKRDEGLIKGQVNVTGKKDVISNDGYAKAATDIKKSKSGLTGLGEKFKDFKHKVGLGVDKVIRPISTRIRKISKGVATRLVKAGFKESIEIGKGNKVIESFQKKFKDLKTDKQGVFWGNVLNGNFDEAAKIAKEGGFEKEFKDVRVWLDDMLKRAQDAGIDVRKMENYFPRLITDSGAMADYIRNVYRGKESSDVVSKIIDDFITKKGVKPTEAEIEEALNKAVRGFGGGNNKAFISGTPFEKERLIDEIPPEMLKFYADPITSLARYNEVMNRNIEMRRFFGKNVKILPNGEYDLLDTVGSYILREKPNLSADEAKELSDMLVARFATLPANTVVKNLKEAVYLAQMNQFLSAITQAGDILPSMYVNGVMPTLKAMLKRKGVKMGDVGLDRISVDMENTGILAKNIERTFKWTGITAVDRFGKETFLNAALDNLKRDAKIFGKTGKENKSITYLREILGDEADAAIKLLKESPEEAMKNENVLFALYNKISRVQPISLSEVPEQYLKHPNGRIFYALKTWTLKMFDTVRTEGLEQMTKGATKAEKIQGAKNLVAMTTLLTMSGVATGTIKDFINGKEFNPTDNAMGSMLQIAGLNRYLFNESNMARGDVSGWTGIVVPGQYIASDIAKDVYGLATGKADLKYEDLNMMKYLPFIGRPVYNRFGKGADTGKKKGGRRKSLIR